MSTNENSANKAVEGSQSTTQESTPPNKQADAVPTTPMATQAQPTHFSPPRSPLQPARSPPTRLSTAHTYNSPLESRHVQNSTTPTRPSPLSRVSFPPPQPEFSIDLNTIDPRLLNFPSPSKLPGSPQSDPLDEIFGTNSDETTANTSPSRQRPYNFYAPENRTLIPPPLSPSTHRQHRRSPTTPLTTSPTPTASPPSLPDLHPSTPLLALPTTLTTSNSITNPTNPTTTTTPPPNQAIVLPSTPQSNLPPPLNPNELRCNLCTRPFIPTPNSLLPDAHGRAYCEACICEVGERVVEAQKVGLGVGRAYARTLSAGSGDGGVTDTVGVVGERVILDEGSVVDGSGTGMGLGLGLFQGWQEAAVFDDEDVGMQMNVYGGEPGPAVEMMGMGGGAERDQEGSTPGGIMMGEAGAPQGVGGYQYAEDLVGAGEEGSGFVYEGVAVRDFAAEMMGTGDEEKKKD